MKDRHFFSQPGKPLTGAITPPGDKSISHRALMLGAIAEGTTTIHGFLESEDCKATLQALKQLGVNIQVTDRVIIEGVGKQGLQAPSQPLDFQNAGTALRLMTGLMAAQSFDSILTGDASLLKRPMDRICIPLAKMGARLRTQAGKPPVYCEGNQSLEGIQYVLPEASAQVKSCLLLAGLYAKSDTIIIEPLPTRDHTERLLATMGCSIKKQGLTCILSHYLVCKATEIHIPGDLSSAAFFIVAATLIPGSQLLIRKTGINPTRLGIIHILQKMGADIRITQEMMYNNEPVGDILVNFAPLQGITIPASLIPLAIDELPIIAIAAACARGDTYVEGAQELRLKESDRIHAMVQGLQNMGVLAQATATGFMIQGGKIQGGEVDSFDDHRVAMSFAIAGQVAQKPILIKNCNKVNTSFPNFIQLAKVTGMDVGWALAQHGR